MKDFLKSHGEKVFLVVMALVCGWSLVGSVRSLGTPSVLPKEDQDAISRIQGQIQKGRPAPREIVLYQEWLGANFDAHGIGKATEAGGPIGERLVYKRPEKAEGRITPIVREVEGSLGRPGKPAAKASRARVTVTWSAPAAAKHVRVDRYEVFSCKAKDERPEKPVGSEPGGSGPFSFTHSNLAPETTYSYWIRAVASPAPPDTRTRVIPPEKGVTVEADSGLWFSELAGPVSGTTLSNIDFECIAVYSEFKKRAVLRVKRWDGEKNEWVIFRSAGVAQGDLIVGKRTRVIPLPPETFKTGYVLKKIEPGNKVIEEEKDDYVEDPPGSGKYKKIKRKVERVIPIQILHIHKADGSRKLRLEYWPGGPKEPAKDVTEGPTDASAKEPAPSPKPKPESKPKPKPEPKDDDPLSKAKKEMEGTGAQRPTPEAPPGTAPAAPKAPEGFKLVKGAGSAAKVLVPKSWAAGLELDHIISGRLLMWDVSADSVAVWGGSVPGSGMVLSDKAMPDRELTALIGRPTEGLSAGKVVGLVCDVLKKKSLKGLAGAAARGENWSVSTRAGTPAAAFAMKVADQTSPLMVAKYFALAPGRLYTVTFVCKAGDYEAQKGIFGKIVGTLDW